jgi:hypothetical protein
MRILSRRQAQATRERIQPMVWFVYRCRERMREIGFDESGSIYRAIDRAYDSLQDLNAELFCQSHGRESAKPPAKPPGVTPARDEAQEPPNGLDA